MANSKIHNLLEKLQHECIEDGFAVRLLHEEGKIADKITIHVFPQEVIEQAKNLQKLKQVEDDYSLILQETVQKRKRKRKKKELPDPSQSSQAWVNRKEYSPTLPTYSTKISPGVSEIVTDFRKKFQISKKDMTEQALTLFMELSEKIK